MCIFSLRILRDVEISRDRDDEIQVFLVRSAAAAVGSLGSNIHSTFTHRFQTTPTPVVKLRIERKKRDRVRLTLVLHNIPKASETHQLPILPRHKMWNLLLPAILLQPLIKSLSHNDAPLPLLHCVPHSAIPHERVITRIDRL